MKKGSTIYFQRKVGAGLRLDRSWGFQIGELTTAARYVDRALPKDQTGILSFEYFHSPVVDRFAKWRKEFGGSVASLGVI